MIQLNQGRQINKVEKGNKLRREIRQIRFSKNSN